MEHPPPPADVPLSPHQQATLDDLIQRFIALGDPPARAAELARFALPYLLPRPLPPPKR